MRLHLLIARYYSKTLNLSSNENLEKVMRCLVPYEKFYAESDQKIRDATTIQEIEEKFRTDRKLPNNENTHDYWKTKFEKVELQMDKVLGQAIDKIVSDTRSDITMNLDKTGDSNSNTKEDLRTKLAR